MNHLFWAGIAISPCGSTVPEYIKIHVSNRVKEMLQRVHSTPTVITVEPDGSRLERHMIEGALITDIFDCTGSRVGFGIEGCDEGDAFSRLEEAHDILSGRLKIIRRLEDVNVWAWDRQANQPELVF